MQDEELGYSWKQDDVQEPVAPEPYWRLLQIHHHDENAKKERERERERARWHE
jgi:hypothetical protein